MKEFPETKDAAQEDPGRPGWAASEKVTIPVPPDLSELLFEPGPVLGRSGVENISFSPRARRVACRFHRMDTGDRGAQDVVVHGRQAGSSGRAALLRCLFRAGSSCLATSADVAVPDHAVYLYQERGHIAVARGCTKVGVPLVSPP